MRKLEKQYVELLNKTLQDKNSVIDDLLRINENVVRETRELIYELRQYLKSTQTENKIEKKVKNIVQKS